MQAVSTGRRYDVACFNALPWRPNEKHDSYRLAHRHDVLRGRFVVRGGKLVGSDSDGRYFSRGPPLKSGYE
jgi:hypothetical protein